MINLMKYKPLPMGGGGVHKTTMAINCSPQMGPPPPPLPPLCPHAHTPTHPVGPSRHDKVFCGQCNQYEYDKAVDKPSLDVQVPQDLSSANFWKTYKFAWPCISNACPKEVHLWEQPRRAVGFGGVGWYCRRCALRKMPIWHTPRRRQSPEMTSGWWWWHLRGGVWPWSSDSQGPGCAGVQSRAPRPPCTSHHRSGSLSQPMLWSCKRQKHIDSKASILLQK